MAYQRFKLPEIRLGSAAVAAFAAVQPQKAPNAASAANAAGGIAKNYVRPAAETAANAANAAGDNPETEISLEERRASVEKIYERMDAERERRRDWWAQPVEGWRPYDGAPVPLYDPARLQREADRRNAAAARNHSTDRFCACGHRAQFAWPGHDGREVWICHECLPTWEAIDAYYGHPSPKC